MPTYDYHCTACDTDHEIFHGMSEPAKKKCPRCGKNKLERRIGAGAGFLFKGSGFYLTDYGRGTGSKSDTSANTKAGKNDSGASSSDSGKSDSTSTSTTSTTESKPAAKAD